EEREIGMPMDYINIYEKCWIPDPSLRPEISEILNDLENLKKLPVCTAKDIQRAAEFPVFDSIIQDLPDIDCITEQMQLNPISTAVLEQSIEIDTFLPVFEKIQQIERTKPPDDDIHLNRRICKVLSQCIIDADHNIKTLRNLEENPDKFATLENFVYFQILLQNIENIKNFMEKISQIGGLQSFIQVIGSEISLNQLKNQYIELIKKFGESISSLNFVSRINGRINNIINEDDETFKDIEETKEFIQALQCNFEQIDILNFINKINTNIQNVTTNFNLFDGKSLDFVKEFQDGIIPKSPDGNITIVKRISYVKEDVRLITAESRNLDIKDTGIRYIAPEILKRNCKTHTKLPTVFNFVKKSDDYNFKSEIYSSMPNEYVEISKQALNPVPNKRPTICHMFKVLYDLVKNDRLKNYQGCCLKPSKKGVPLVTLSDYT
ncbi:10011_t:CDS:2, partial [Dentiscutata erythropus]